MRRPTHTHNLFRPAGLTRKGNYTHLQVHFLKVILVSESPYVLFFWLMCLFLLPSSLRILVG